MKQVTQHLDADEQLIAVCDFRLPRLGATRTVALSDLALLLRVRAVRRELHRAKRKGDSAQCRQPSEGEQRRVGSVRVKLSLTDPRDLSLEAGCIEAAGFAESVLAKHRRVATMTEIRPGTPGPTSVDRTRPANQPGPTRTGRDHPAGRGAPVVLRATEFNGSDVAVLGDATAVGTGRSAPARFDGRVD